MGRNVFAIVLGSLCCSIAGAQQLYDPTPPIGVLWEMEADGDAIQKDLGFNVPAQWKDFHREGFSSTRADGGSVKAYYRQGDAQSGGLKMTVWIQLRADIRGLPLDAETVWSLMKIGIGSEFGLLAKDKVTTLSEAPFSLGGRTPAGKELWTRIDLPTGVEVQGAWWQNIGVWAVVITMSGPEARRADIETASKTLLAEMPFPSAPLITEMLVNGEQIMSAMPQCPKKRPEGAGKEVVPTFAQGALYGLLVPGMQLGQNNAMLISPVTHSKDYCVIESFKLGAKDLPVTAIQYLGPPGEVWQARYGFVINKGRGGYYQLERLVPGTVEMTAVKETRLEQVYLDFSSTKRVELISVFDDWPSYETAKAALANLVKNKGQPIIAAIQTAEKRVVQTNNARVQEATSN